MAPDRLLTLGHSTLAADDFVEQARSAGLSRIVDVRSFPGSRRHPQFGREALAGRLADAGIGYAWEQRLGGRRQGVGERSVHLGLREPAFRSYADWMETVEFRIGLSTLTDSPPGLTAMMCSEALWWRCHRRLLADHLVLVERIPVWHLTPDGSLDEHTITPEARLADPPESRIAASMVIYGQPTLFAASPE